MTAAVPAPIPHGRTARRLEWPHLPPHVRAGIEQRCGSAVVEAVSQGGGFTPGFASVLVCEDGSRHFVKAASTVAQGVFADVVPGGGPQAGARCPETIPAPRLLWVEDDDWVVLGLEYVEARAPQRPWRADELDLCLDAIETVADRLTPAPGWSGPGSDRRRARGLAGALGHGAHDRDTRPHADEAAALAATFAEVAGGETLVHTDLRDDNVLLTDRRSCAVLRLELAGGRRRLDGLADPADLPAR